jgi:hypothetical protein
MPSAIRARHDRGVPPLSVVSSAVIVPRGTATSVAAMRCDAAMHRRLNFAFLSALVTLALVGALPACAGAQSGGSPFPTVSLSAKTTSGRFQGRFVIRRFRVRAPGLAAFGRLTGTLRDRRYPTTERVRNAPFSFTVALARVPSGSCARIAINFAPLTTPVVGLAATFGPRTLVLRPRHGTGPSTGELLCGVSAAVAANAPPTVTVHLLNALRLQYA